MKTPAGKEMLTGDGNPSSILTLAIRLIASVTNSLADLGSTTEMRKFSVRLVNDPQQI